MQGLQSWNKDHDGFNTIYTTMSEQTSEKPSFIVWWYKQCEEKGIDTFGTEACAEMAWQASEAYWSKRCEEMEKIRFFAIALVDALETCHNDSSYQAAWFLWHNHFGQYKGPKYENALNSLKGAISTEVVPKCDSKG